MNYSQRVKDSLLAGRDQSTIIGKLAPEMKESGIDRDQVKEFFKVALNLGPEHLEQIDKIYQEEQEE